MPRLPKEESEKYQAGLAEWEPKVLDTIQELAETSENKVKRSEIVANLGEGFEDRFMIPIFTKLLEEGHIAKTGASRGRGARWGVPEQVTPEDVPQDPDTVEMPEEPQVESQPALSTGLVLQPPTVAEITNAQVDTALKTLSRQERAELRKSVKEEAFSLGELAETLGLSPGDDPEKFIKAVKRRLFR